MKFQIGQRVRTTVDAPAAWPGAFSAPAGALGTIRNVFPHSPGYGVRLDGDPGDLPAFYEETELEAAK